MVYYAVPEGTQGLWSGSTICRLHDLPVDVWHWMGYTRRPPKLDCFRDFLMKLDPEVLDQALSEWIVNELQLDLDEV